MGTPLFNIKELVEKTSQEHLDNNVFRFKGDDLTFNGINDNGDGTYTWFFSDGTQFTTSNLIGPQGPQGNTGIQGIKGDTGEKGDTGSAGPQGLKGDTGDQGQGIDHISKTLGTSGPGTTDTYTVWADAGETNQLGTFTVYNGRDADAIFTVEEKNKLATIEPNAKDDQTASEIEALYEGLANTNKYTDSEKNKVATALTSETVTSLSINANILSFVDENGATTNIDLSIYLDDTNLARLVSGSVNPTTGIATFTRDDATTFTVDMSALLDDTTVTVEDVLTSVSTENALSANMGRQLNDTKQDNLVSGTNIKTINGEDITGSGDITISAGSGGFAANLYFSDVQSTIEPSYKTLSYTPDTVSVQKDIICNTGETSGEVYLFELPIDTDRIDAGSWIMNFYSQVDNNNGETFLRYEAFMREDGTGIETTLFSSTSRELDDIIQYREFQTTQSLFTVNPTARYGIRVFANTNANQNRTVSYIVGDGNASYSNTPVATRHDQLRNRDEIDSHPIGAITNLQTELDERGSYYELSTEPNSVKVGDEWLNTDTEKRYKRISDGVNEAWIQVNQDIAFGLSSYENRTVTSDSNLLDSDLTLFANASSNNINIDLPTAIGRTKKIYNIIRTDNSGFELTITPFGSQKINGNDALNNIAQYDSIVLVSDGSNWYIR